MPHFGDMGEIASQQWQQVLPDTLGHLRAERG
jgi:hypothetical protein